MIFNPYQPPSADLIKGNHNIDSAALPISGLLLPFVIFLCFSAFSSVIMVIQWIRIENNWNYYSIAYHAYRIIMSAFIVIVLLYVLKKKKLARLLCITYFSWAFLSRIIEHVIWLHNPPLNIVFDDRYYYFLCVSLLLLSVCSIYFAKSFRVKATFIR